MDPTKCEMNNKEIGLTQGDSSPREQNFRRLGQDFKTDLDTLVKQHIAVIKAEGIPSFRTIIGGLFSFGLLTILCGFVLLRLVDAGVASLGASWAWSPAVEALAAGILLMLLAFGCALISRNLFRRSGHGLQIIWDEMKEDYQWLKKIL